MAIYRELVAFRPIVNMMSNCYTVSTTGSTNNACSNSTHATHCARIVSMLENVCRTAYRVDKFKGICECLRTRQVPLSYDK